MNDGLTKAITISAMLTLIPFGIVFLLDVIKSRFWIKREDALKKIKESLVYYLCVIPGSFFSWLAILSPSFTYKKYGILIGLATGFCLLFLGIAIIVYSLRIRDYFCKHKKGENEND